MVDKGVSWNVGKVFFKQEQVYSFDLLPEAGHERPAFINLQQYYVEGYLAERAAQLPLIDLRWKNKVAGVEQHDHVTLSSNPMAPTGWTPIRGSCDGGRSAMRARAAGGRAASYSDSFLSAA